MVHADASNFDSNVSKQEAYAQVLEQARGLFFEQRNWVCNLSNAASLLWHCLHALPSPSNHTNWTGFYVLDPSSPPTTQLILGPFQGKVACQTIRFGRGVCGVAAQTKTTQVVSDVEMFPGHIACDAESKSEIVVPVIQNGEVVAIIDVDCAVKDAFDDEDKKALEELAQLIADSCDF
ncbi:GAF domain-like protein [Aureobasidium pullulans EXF-150]|uniref:GAF domain-like protein n=1 Tax=Aureobasidium pullulans EXF-150 TaxID=1043002 RepID=A0A074XZL1_AURPU|nr:GAF domain-like protein [Aureobasidium pullulans EXF-150]KEQ87417.1 GAF domain-like protein [Aureobasidium pullulans EXF-150]